MKKVSKTLSKGLLKIKKIIFVQFKGKLFLIFY